MTHTQRTICGFLINKKGAKVKGGKICQEQHENVENKIWQKVKIIITKFSRSAVMQSQGTEGSFGNFFWQYVLWQTQ